jgi:hypothetical protein
VPIGLGGEPHFGAGDRQRAGTRPCRLPSDDHLGAALFPGGLPGGAKEASHCGYPFATSQALSHPPAMQLFLKVTWSKAGTSKFKCSLRLAKPESGCNPNAAFGWREAAKLPLLILEGMPRIGFGTTCPSLFIRI